MAFSSNPERCANMAWELSQSCAEAGGSESRRFAVPNRRWQAYIGGELPIIAVNILDLLRCASQRPEVYPGPHAPFGRHAEALPASRSSSLPGQFERLGGFLTG